MQLVELEDNNFHLVASSVLPDGTTGYWIVDTGASKTVFDLNLADNFKKEKGKQEEIHTAGIREKPMKTTIGQMKRFSVGKMKVNNLRVALLDLSHINSYYAKATDYKICGLLGGDFLLEHKAVLDYRKRILFLRKI